MPDTEPSCTCEKPDGAHDEKCAVIRWMRSPAYDVGDLQIPAFLRRGTPSLTGGVFD